MSKFECVTVSTKVRERMNVCQYALNYVGKCLLKLYQIQCEICNAFTENSHQAIR